jgi:hypothetical protein
MLTGRKLCILSLEFSQQLLESPGTAIDGMGLLSSKINYHRVGPHPPPSRNFLNKQLSGTWAGTGGRIN